MPASTRGSSWATSATTNIQPSSATAAGRTCTGNDSAPPPLDDHRPVVGAGRLVRRPEPAAAHPLVDPGPAVGLEQVRELLVAQQRVDARVLERAQGGRPGVGDVQPGPAQRRQQLGPRVGVEARRVERVAHLGDQRLQPLRPGTARRPRPEQVGEQPLVDVDPPRHAGVRHLGRDEGTRRLRREQQPEPGGLGRRRHGRQLPGVLEVGAQVLGRVVDREQRRVGRHARPEPVPVLRLLPRPAAAASTAGARRSRWWPSRRSWQRSTRTPAASSGGYHRAVSSHTQRGASTSRARTYAGRSATATSRSAPPSTTSTRSPGRRESETRVMGTPWHYVPTLKPATRARPRAGRRSDRRRCRSGRRARRPRRSRRGP